MSGSDLAWILAVLIVGGYFLIGSIEPEVVASKTGFYGFCLRSMTAPFLLGFVLSGLGRYIVTGSVSKPRVTVYRNSRP